MRVLIIEDDEHKRNHLVSFLQDTVANLTVLTAASYNSGLRQLTNSQPDLVLLDMTLPTFDISAYEHGGGSELYGGRELLEQMEYKKIAVPVIVVTQFDRFGDPSEAVTLAELDEELQRKYGASYRGAVFYDSTKEGWKASLTKRIAGLKMGSRR